MPLWKTFIQQYSQYMRPHKASMHTICLWDGLEYRGCFYSVYKTTGHLFVFCTALAGRKNCCKELDWTRSLTHGLICFHLNARHEERFNCPFSFLKAWSPGFVTCYPETQHSKQRCRNSSNPQHLMIVRLSYLDSSYLIPEPSWLCAGLNNIRQNWRLQAFTTNTTLCFKVWPSSVITKRSLKKIVKPTFPTRSELHAGRVCGRLPVI